MGIFNAISEIGSEILLDLNALFNTRKCPEGGDHEWKYDDNEKFCIKCGNIERIHPNKDEK